MRASSCRVTTSLNGCLLSLRRLSRCPASTTRHVRFSTNSDAHFSAVGRLGRLPEPTLTATSFRVSTTANEILRAQRLQGINGDMLLAAAIAWGDVVWRAPDKAIGQGLELALRVPNHWHAGEAGLERNSYGSRRCSRATAIARHAL